MRSFIAALLFFDFLIGRSELYGWDYAVDSRAFFAALLSTVVVKYCNNSFYFLVSAWLWLDFFNLVLCEEINEPQYFGVMAVTCAYLISNKSLK